ncbi:unnamed protein product [Phytophthora fragariaefolia]|uniref:Unnamed protein product n=1 Tax=Phytophthora fragariaefolia TaxID=1490495 RepID=A0A9W6X0W7_9STRA|nr:unnamed protein product [Phytophthora fragariaefolia]
MIDGYIYIFVVSLAEAMASEDGGDLWGRPDDCDLTYVVEIPTARVALTAVQDRAVCAGTPAFPSHGHCVWDAALLLADYLQMKAAETAQQDASVVDGGHRFHFKGKKAVELGAGVGLVGMTLAVLGAQVVLTDQEYALPLLAKNVDVNFRDKVDVDDTLPKFVAPAVEECQWGEPFKLGSSLASWKKSADVVVFSDVLYHASAFLLLIETLHELVSPSTDVFFSFETRNASIEANFLQQLGRTFKVEEASREDHVQVFATFEYPDELFIYHARLKTDSNGN